MSPRTTNTVGAVLAAVGVLLGAYGAHGLTDQLERFGYTAEEAVDRAATRWETAVRYQMYHAIGLVLVGALARMRGARRCGVAPWAFLTGVELFCGLLYVMTFTGESWRWLGIVVPLGGVAFIVGWIALGVEVWSANPDD